MCVYQQTDRRPLPRPELESYEKHREYLAEGSTLTLSLVTFSSVLYPNFLSCLTNNLSTVLTALRRQQDGGFFKGHPYPSYPFLMIPDLTNPYISNGSLSPSARTVSDRYCCHFLTHSHSSDFKWIFTAAVRLALQPRDKKLSM